MAAGWRNGENSNFEWDRSFSEPDLTDPLNHLGRFAIKNPHEYISVDDLKFFRRRKPSDFHTHSSVCLYNKDEPVLPFGSQQTEYRTQFHNFAPSLRPPLLRRSTSLHLEGLMQHKSENQEQYHWYSPEDCRSSRSFPIRNPENLHVGGGYHSIDMSPEYRSSYISHPIVDRSTKILPREMFHIEPKAIKSSAINQIAESAQTPSLPERSTTEITARNKLAEDKLKRELASREQQKCHLQERSTLSTNHFQSTEYQRQFIQYPLEKAHSIPQISHLNMKGDFVGVPEYSANFKVYDGCYSKSAPLKKVDNLQQSGAETTLPESTAHAAELPEYQEKFRDPPSDGATSKHKSLRTYDHLHPCGDFSRDLPEYHESFRDPQVTQKPERGKCRESLLRLNGKIEFNPEYRSTYLDFPRSRPIIKKSTSSFRLPTATVSNSNSTSTTKTGLSKSPKRTPRRKYKSSSPPRYRDLLDPTIDLTATPEYRRAQYNYQLRERTPPRKPLNEPELASRRRKNSIAYPMGSTAKVTTSHLATNKRRQPRHRAPPINTQDKQQATFENITRAKVAAARFGRRASVLQNAMNCPENASIVEGNPKYALPSKLDKYNRENQDSFVVLKEPCKRTNWMKKSWYES